MNKSKASVLGPLVLNGITTLIGGLSLLAFTPIYKILGGYELVGLIGFYMALTVLTQFMDGGLSLTATKIVAEMRSLEKFRVIEIKFFKSILIAFFGVLLLFLLLYVFDLSLELSKASIISAIFAHLVFYFYSQVALGLDLHSHYSIIFLIYNAGRHVLFILLILMGISIDGSILLLPLFILTFIFCLRKKIIRELSTALVSDIKTKDDTDKYATGIMFGAIAGGVLASADRLLAIEMFGPYQSGLYFSSFVLASLLALIPVPIYRVFFSRFSSLHKSEPTRFMRELNVATEITVLSTCFVALFIIFFRNEILTLWLGEFTSLQVDIALVLISSFLFISIGWMPAAALQSQGFQFIQTRVILAATVIGLVFIILASKNMGILAMTSIWLVHGFFQAIYIPFVAIKRLNIPSRFYLYRALYLSPVLVSIFLVFGFFVKENTYVTVLFILLVILFTVMSVNCIKNALKL